MVKIHSSLSMESKVKKPSFFWFITETGRALAELGFYLPYKTLNRYKETGDGHPVLVLPGFMASDFSTKPLRKFLKKAGYTAYGWEMGRNFAAVESVDELIEKVALLYEEHQQEISIIGWSLGGVYARQIAKANPQYIRQIITLGSPFRGIGDPNNATWLYNLISGGKRVVDLDPDLLNDLPKPAPVPTTAIYSKEDGVVPWEVCLEAEETDIHQNIQVRGSHLGLGINPSVLNIVADRLQYDKSDWTHFEPKNFFTDLLLYPSI